MAGRSSRTFAVLLALAVLDSTGYSIIGPVLPELASATGASATTLGLLTASFPLTMLLGFVLGVRLLRRSRHGVLVGGLALLVAGSSTFVLSDNLALLFAGRMVMGLGSGALWIAVTFSTLEYWPGGEYVRMSRVYAAYSVGALMGPALGALPGSHRPFVVYALLLALAVPLVSTLPAPEVELPTTSDWSALRVRGFWFSALAIMFAMVAFGTLDGVLPLHLATGWSQQEIGLAYAGAALLVTVSATTSGHLRPVVALALGGVGIVAGIAAAGLASEPGVWLVSLALVGLGAGAAETGATGTLLDAVPTDRIVTAMVVWSQLGITGYLVAPALGAPIADAFGFGTVGLVPLAVGLVVLVLGIVTRLRNRDAAPASGPPPSRV